MLSLTILNFAKRIVSRNISWLLRQRSCRKMPAPCIFAKPYIEIILNRLKQLGTIAYELTPFNITYCTLYHNFSANPFNMQISYRSKSRYACPLCEIIGSKRDKVHASSFNWNWLFMIIVELIENVWGLWNFISEFPKNELISFLPYAKRF